MKLRTDIANVYRELHSWVGVVAGLFLFIAFYAGAISMFEPALETWLTPRISLPEAVPLERAPELMGKVFAAFPESRRSYTIVVSTDPDHPARMVWSPHPARHGHGSQTLMMAALDSRGGLVTAQRRPSSVAQVIDTLHQQMGLPLPHEPAMIVMGFITLGYALALVSGTLIFLPALARAIFAVRLKGSVRRKWLDLHNLLGFCSLPFHIVMALTSVVFAFHDVIFTVQAEFLSHEQNEVRQGGHGMRAMAALSQQGMHPAHETTALTPAEVVSILSREVPGFTPDTLDYSIRPGSVPMLRIAGHDPAHIMRGPNSGFTTMDPFTGRLLWRDYLPGYQSRSFAALTSFFSLHFGSYGGAPVRWAYLVLGFAGAFLFYTGNRLWIAVRRRKEKASGLESDTRGTRILWRLTVGCCAGCMAGIAIILLVAMFQPGLNARLSPFWLYQGVFWLFMGLSCLGILDGSWFFLVASILNLAVVAGALRHFGTDSETSLGVALVALALGVSVGYSLWRKMRLRSVPSSAH